MRLDSLTALSDPSEVRIGVRTAYIAVLMVQQSQRRFRRLRKAPLQVMALSLAGNRFSISEADGDSAVTKADQGELLDYLVSIASLVGKQSLLSLDSRW
jgi:hypothetical protein